MKYTIILIVTVFLIGISVSEGKGEKGEGNKKGAGDPKTDTSKKGGKKEEQPVKEDKKDKDSTDDKDKTTDEDEEDGSGTTDDEEEEEEEEVKQPQKKQSSPKKQQPAKKESSPKKGSAKKRTDDSDEELEDKPKGKAQKSPTFADLKNQAASMNPANLIAALQNTPVNELKKVLPQMKKLGNMLDGTPMGPIIDNLTSLMGNSSPQIWNGVFKLFPNFVASIINTVAQLTATGATAFGRAGKSVVEVADVLFNAGKDVLGEVTMLPGGNLLTPLGQVLDVLHGTVVDPLDSAADELKASGKRNQKRLARAASRSRSGRGGGGLFGASNGLFGANNGPSGADGDMSD